MEEAAYLKLKRLTELGDRGAAQQLLEEGRRLGDREAVAMATALLGPHSSARRYTLKRRRKNPRAQELLAQLNPEQRAVVQAGSGPLLVIAGAGSGKTRTLTFRVAHLLEMGVSPQAILLLTFTNKAAREMIERVSGLIGPAATQLWGGTFHHIAHRLLRRHAQLLGYPESFTVMDGEDVSTLMGVCTADVGVDRKRSRFPIKDLPRLISFSINTGRSLEQVVEEKSPHFKRFLPAFTAVAKRYRERKQAMGLMDFDDLLINWQRLFNEHPEIAQRYSARFEHVLVDEYQDTNFIQSQIVDLCVKHHRNLMVVGDDCQSIYSFRGANFANILRFPERYPEAKRFMLEQNYRSTPEVLALANLSITFNHSRFEKALRTERASGMLPVVIPCRDMNQQAEFVTERVLELNETGVPLKRIAILYRAHYQSIELQAELTRAGVPYSIRSGLRFFEQAHIKDVLAILRFVFNPRDELSFSRALKLLPGVGDKSTQKLWRELKQAPNPLQELLKDAVKLGGRASKSLARFKTLLRQLSQSSMQQLPGSQIGAILDGDYKDYLEATFANADLRLSDLEQLASYAAQFESLEAFLSELALVNNLTGEDMVEGGAPEDHLILTTVHQAKGLEWPHVFVTSLWDGGFPSAAGQRDQESIEEERRLFYVATTRAMDELYLSYPLSRRDRDGWHRVQRPSLFLEELTDTQPPLFERWTIDAY